MTSHRPSRWLAPLALLAALGAVLLIVQATTGGGGDSSTNSESGEEREAATGEETASTGEESEGGRTSTRPRAKTYTVRPGDTLAAISERTGVSVEDLMELNPDIDPNSLTVGEKIKLTE